MTIFSTDHKTIGLQYGVTSAVFLLVGFSLMMLMRWQLAYPMQPIPLIGRFLGPHLVAQGVDATNPVGLDRSSPHGGDDVVAVNQIHLPLGRTVIVQLSSKDVVHSFGVPAMRVMQDAIPGMMIPVWFTPTLAGAYDVACCAVWATTG